MLHGLTMRGHSSARHSLVVVPLHARRLLGVPLAFAALTACGGSVEYNRNEAGNDTYVGDTDTVAADPFTPGVYWGMGSIALDPGTQTALVVRSKLIDDEDGERHHTGDDHLLAARPDGTSAHVLDVSGRSDLRIVFGRDATVLLSEEADHDVLTYLDRETFELLHVQEASVRYHGTRSSPSRRYLAVADNTHDTHPTHLIDTTTREAHVLEHIGAGDLEAEWLNGTDILVGAIFEREVWTTTLDNEEIAGDEVMQLYCWDMSAVESRAFALGNNGLFSDPACDVVLEHVVTDNLFFHAWIGVSPENQSVAIPVLDVANWEAVMNEGAEASLSAGVYVIDLVTGGRVRIPGARGPVAYTPDGSTVVSYRAHSETVVNAEGEEEQRTVWDLLLYDVATQAETEIRLDDLTWAPQFFVTSHGHHVIVTDPFGTGDALLLDLDTNGLSSLSPDGFRLAEFVERREAAEILFIDGGLFRLDLGSDVADEARLSAVSLGFSPAHLNIASEDDTLVFDDGANAARIRFVDPDTYQVVGQADLPLQALANIDDDS